MGVDDIEVETALAYLLEDLATELQLIARDLKKRPFACVQERLSGVCDALVQTRYVALTIGLGEPYMTRRLISKITLDTGNNSSAADAASELTRSQQRASRK